MRLRAWEEWFWEGSCEGILFIVMRKNFLGRDHGTGKGLIIDTIRRKGRVMTGEERRAASFTYISIINVSFWKRWIVIQTETDIILRSNKNKYKGKGEEGMKAFEVHQTP